MTVNADFEVKVIKSGTPDDIGDRNYHFKIYSKKSENEVRRYCMTELLVSYNKNEMPHAFVGELISFKNLTKMELDIGNCYEYIVKKSSTS